MSAEELALCSAIAEFRNSIFSLEPPWGASDMRGVNDKLLLQLIDVSSHPVYVSSKFAERSILICQNLHVALHVRLGSRCGNGLSQCWHGFSEKVR